jgi:DNA-binding transcriptional regulator YhcF (GntR family)
MSHKTQSTFEQEMQNPAFKQAFDESYKELLLSELVHALMDEDTRSVRKLAAAIGVSPTTIQGLRSGEKKDIRLSNFIEMVKEFGYHLVLERKNKRIQLA